jgi:hypothetical protein
VAGLRVWTILAAALGARFLAAQSADVPTFDVAAIKPNSSNEVPQALYNAAGATLRRTLRFERS